MEASITLKKVGKKIDDKTIVAGLTFGIERGSLVAIIGANDTGKSTLLNIIGILDELDSGEYTLDGIEIKDLTEKKAAQYPAESRCRESVR